jgi:hypothetical protein
MNVHYLDAIIYGGHLEKHINNVWQEFLRVHYKWLGVSWQRSQSSTHRPRTNRPEISSLLPINPHCGINFLTEDGRHRLLEATSSFTLFTKK